MRYHNITKNDMLNGDGLRVVLWLSGCTHECKNCHNPMTHQYNSGLEFDNSAKEEIFKELKKPHISGITLSGGDPLFEKNRNGVLSLIYDIKNEFPNKTIWIYTGYLYEEIIKQKLIGNCMEYIDVLVDGKFIEALKDGNHKWAGSTNQRIIDVKKTLIEGSVILYSNLKNKHS